MKSDKLFYFLLSLLALATNAMAKPDNSIITMNSEDVIIDSAVFNINQINNNFENDGSLVSSAVTSESGFQWPKGMDIGMCFQSGIWIAGKDPNGNLRTACSEYTSEFNPGKILPDGTPDDPTNSKYKIYTINKGNTTNSDYQNWPADDGAPFDESGNPLFLGDQTHWFVCNDADTARHARLFNTKPIGVECQYTIFGVDSIQGLENVMFVKGLLIHKGDTPLDSVYIGLWNDPDLGDAHDDMVACDSTRKMGYCYNGDDYDSDYGTKIPAYGVQMLQSPIIPSAGDTAHFLGNVKPDYKNSEISSFTRYIGASMSAPDPQWPSEVYNYLKGIGYDGTPITNPTTGDTVNISFPGDPVTQTGWYEDVVGDKRFMLSTGPFNFAPGDTQEVVLAYMAGRGVDSTSGIRSLRKTAELTKSVYENNFMDINLPVGLYHRYQTGFETTSGTNFDINIKTEDGISLKTDECYLYYALDSAETFQQMTLLELDNSGSYGAIIPDDGEVHYIQYYFSIKTTNECIYTLPIAAPYVYYEEIIGPDLISPELSTFWKNLTTSIFLSGSKYFNGWIDYTDRSPVGDIQMETKTNNGEWSAVSNPLFTSLTQSTYFTGSYECSFEWSVNATWSSAQKGDIIDYRIVVSDSTQAANQSYIDIARIKIGNEESIIDIAYEKYITSEDYHKQWIADNWYYYNYFNLGVNYIAKPDTTQGYYGKNLNATLTYSKPIPLCDYDSLSLKIYHIANSYTGDTAYIEVSSDKQEWQVVEKTSTISPYIFQWDNCTIKPGLSSDTCYLRLRFKSNDQGTEERIGWWVNDIRLVCDSTIVAIEEPVNQVYTFKLNPNFPNPFNPTTTISFELPKAVKTEINIYNLRGQLVETLVNKDFSAGRHQVNWNAGNLPSGVYLYQIKAGDFQNTRKCILLK